MQDNPSSIRRHVLDVVEQLLPQIHIGNRADQHAIVDPSNVNNATITPTPKVDSHIQKQPNDEFLQQLASGLLERLDDEELAARNQVCVIAKNSVNIGAPQQYSYFVESTQVQ